MSDTAAEPLINSHNTNDDVDFDRIDDARHSEEAEDLDVDESQLVRPGAFIWALTLCAGISGLLFGYEYVSLVPRRIQKHALLNILTLNLLVPPRQMLLPLCVMCLLH